MKQKIIIPLLLVIYLGLHNGYLALWDTNTQQPVEIFPYRCSIYPKIDQRRLLEGIPIDTPDTLKTLLEDFLS